MWVFTVVIIYLLRLWLSGKIDVVSIFCHHVFFNLEFGDKSLDCTFNGLFKCICKGLRDRGECV